MSKSYSNWIDDPNFDPQAEVLKIANRRIGGFFRFKNYTEYLEFINRTTSHMRQATEHQHQNQVAA